MVLVVKKGGAAQTVEQHQWHWTFSLLGVYELHIRRGNAILRMRVLPRLLGHTVVVLEGVFVEMPDTKALIQPAAVSAEASQHRQESIFVAPAL